MSERPEQERVRIQKLAELREKGFNYPNDSRPTGTSADIQNAEIVAPEESKRFVLAGRIVQMRAMGKASFCHLLDTNGKIQVYVRHDQVGDEAYGLFKHYDLGDIIEVSGYPFVTKTGEKSLFVEKVRLLAKSLIPLPEKWHGLSDVEARYRYRYVDLISNPEVRDVFRKRAQIIRGIRSYLDSHGFMEVETPILSYAAGGGIARPFKTHYHALDTGMSLRIALELPLKKLIVGGIDRVYEIGRNFRNEGLSKKHNPEFTMVEFYQAYATFEDMLQLTEELITKLVQDLHGALKVEFGEKQIDFKAPWPRMTMSDSLHELGGVDHSVDLNDLAELKKLASQHKIDLTDDKDWGTTLENVWGHLVEPKIINPVFITRHPLSISPLAKRSADDPRVTDRFELIVCGMEIANAFSELNDPEDQLDRFQDQLTKTKGEAAHTEVDYDFVRALEHGMPPTGGEGIGIDRLVMLLTNSPTIREVLLFPQLKPLDTESADNEESKGSE